MHFYEHFLIVEIPDLVCEFGITRVLFQGAFAVAATGDFRLSAVCGVETVLVEAAARDEESLLPGSRDRTIHIRLGYYLCSLGRRVLVM